MGKRDLLSTLSTLDKGPGKHVYPCVPCVGAPAFNRLMYYHGTNQNVRYAQLSS